GHAAGDVLRIEQHTVEGDNEGLRCPDGHLRSQWLWAYRDRRYGGCRLGAERYLKVVILLGDREVIGLINAMIGNSIGLDLSKRTARCDVALGREGWPFLSLGAFGWEGRPVGQHGQARVGGGYVERANR